MNRLITFVLLCVTMCGHLSNFNGVSAADYPIKLQPEFDRFDIPKYFTNDRLMRLQFECLIFDGPCDIVGKFIKPRSKAALEKGECLQCTPFQEKLMVDFLQLFKERFPAMYKAAVTKIIDNDGAELVPEEKAKLREVFNPDAVTGFLTAFDDFPLGQPDAANNSSSNANETPSENTVKLVETPASSA